MVDDEDYERASKQLWYKYHARGKWYVKAVDGSGMLLHRLLTDAAKGAQVDHRNGDGLDNQRARNLRVCTHAQNQQNRSFLKPNNSSGFNGVSWHSRAKKWEARIYRGKEYRLGLFAAKEDAVAARVEAERRLFGEFAPSLNRAA